MSTSINSNLTKACLLHLVDTMLAFNVWLYVPKHANHDTPEAGRPNALSHSVWARGKS